MAIQLTTSFQKVVELISKVTSNTTGYSRLYLRYDNSDRNINELTDKVYYEIRQYAYNPYGSYFAWSNSSATSWSIKNSSETNLANGSYIQSGFYSNSGEIVRASGSFTIKHNEDGSWSDVIKFSDYVYTQSLNQNVEISLPNIDRLATITSYPESLTDEDTIITFSYSNPVNFKVKVNAMVTQESGIGFSYDEYITENPFSWNWLATDEDKKRLYSVTRNSTAANLSLRLQTYDNNDQLLGITAVSIPLSIVNAEPFVEIEVEEQNEKVKNIVGSELIAVNYVSQLKATATFTGTKNGTLRKISINNTIGTESPLETIINVTDEHSSSAFVVTTSVEDSRGLTNSDETIYQLADYRPVSIDSYKFKRENPTSDKIYLNADLTYWQIKVNDVNNVPILSYSTDGVTYIVIPQEAYTIDETNKSISINNYEVPTTLNYKNQGTYYLKVEDNFTEDIENEIVTKGIAVFEKGVHDVQVNGDLIVADEDRQNPVNVLTEIKNKVVDNLDDNATDKAPSQKAVNDTFSKLKMTTTIINNEQTLATITNPVTIDLNESIQDYDMIYVSLRGDWNHMFSCIMLPTFLQRQHINIDTSNNYYVKGYCGFPTDKTFNVTLASSAGWSGIYLNAIVGIKFNNI